jgi:hypothetical protein
MTEFDDDFGLFTSPNIVALTAALVQRWPMTNLLDILKETELRVGFTEAFRKDGAREKGTGS